jgi:hypothetical protein
MSVLLREFQARLAAVTVVAALAGAALAADATPEAQRVQTVIDLLKKGDAAAAIAKLGEGPALLCLSSDPYLVQVVCDRAFRFDSAKADADLRRTLAARLLELAKAANTAAPADDRTRWALAEAYVLTARANPETGAMGCDMAATLLEKVYAGHPGDSLPLVYAASFTLEGACACADPNSVLALSNRADALAKKAMDGQRDSATLAVSIGTSQLWAARTIWPANHKVSRNQVKSALETLRPFATRKSPAVDAAGLWNDAVEFGLVSEMGLPERIVTAPHLVLDGRLLLDVPVSPRWSLTTVPGTDEQPAYEYVTEVDASGTRLRQVIFRSYAWNQQYTFENPVPCGGDNVKTIALGLQEMSAARIFAPGATTPAPARRPFCKELDGYAFEAAGKTAAGPTPEEQPEPLHLYGYVVRGRDQTCYAALVYVYGKDDRLGTGMATLVASLRPPER